jgi:GT2 family glycosyltransferase
VSKDKIVSVIIPTFKRKNDLLRLLRSVAESNYPKDSGGRLYGAKVAAGQYFFFIDDDNILDKNCIKYLADSLYTDKALGMAGPLMLLFNDKNRIWAAGARVSNWGTTTHVESKKYVNELTLPDKILNIDYFPNAFMVKRRILEQIPFDVVHFPHNWSEPDFGLRVKQKGYSAATITNAYEWHDVDYGGMTTRINARNVYDQTKSRILFRKRFFSSINSWLLFWSFTFPVSTLYYMKSIFESKDKKKLNMISGYFKGTIDGIKSNMKPDISQVS